jgi:SPP1 gp7 family putative phage head morphogenesis protein
MMINLSVKVAGLEPEFLRVANLIYSGHMKPGQIDKAMVKKIGDELMKGIFKGYGKKLDAKKLPAETRTFLTGMRKNVYVFSGFKNHHELKEVSLLVNNKGKLRAFHDFLADVKQVDKTYNEVYLSAEYGNCIASGQMARTWQDFTDNGVDMLTYQTAGDDRVRAEHAILNDITLPTDDDFWDIYFPPNDWGCRCDAVPAGPGAKEQSISGSGLPDLPPMFRNNVGKSGIVFPDTHPYFDVNKQTAADIRDQVNQILKEEE